MNKTIKLFTLHLIPKIKLFLLEYERKNLMYRLTVAGDAASKSMGSKMRLVVGAS